MEKNEIHLIFIRDAAGHRHRIGFTRNPQVSASILRKNFQPKYQKIAERFGVVSLFCVEAVYEYGPSALEHWMKVLCVGILEEVEKEIEEEEKERQLR